MTKNTIPVYPLAAPIMGAGGAGAGGGGAVDRRGTKKVEEAARIIVQTAMDTNGPTGKFICDYGETPW
ncbi:MAG TPA: hypothetical protein VGS79_11035 [Puia sp.]|nr:hypothetical protein [Puia sp.]